MKHDNQGIWIGEKDLTRDPEFIDGEGLISYSGCSESL